METQTKEKYWQEQINDWKASGLNQKQFCLSRSLALSTFCYWKSKTNRIESPTQKFYPLTVPVLPGYSSDAGLILLVGSKQYQVQIKKDFSGTALKRLVTTLEEI
jgi:hypothetical protein